MTEQAINALRRRMIEDMTIRKRPIVVSSQRRRFERVEVPRSIWE